MAHFDQVPSPPQAEAHTVRNARYGLVLFAAYAAFYGVFMLLNAFWPQVVETVVFAGINLAVIYGLGLIVTAFVLALVYVWLCRNPLTPTLSPEGRGSNSGTEARP